MPRHPSRYAVAVLPFASLTPRACGALAVALEDSQAVFARWGLQTGDLGRIGAAIRHLRHVATTESFGTTAAELHRTARAIFVANDFYAITRSLSAERQDPIARELTPIFEGLLEESPTSRRGYEIQTQFWLGALLAHSRLHPAVPTGTGRLPDFLVTVRGVRLAVEVKCPQSASGVRRALDEAERQIRASGIPGFIAMDLSDALRTFDLGTTARGPRETVRARFDAEARRLINYIRLRQRPSASPADSRSSFNRVAGLLVYARFCGWTDSAGTSLDFGFFLKGQTFPKAAAGFYEPFAEQLLDQIPEGIRQMTGNPMRPY